jgi:hypothetical protein
MSEFHRARYEAIVGDLIHESRPGVVGVEFDEDGKHVYLALAGEGFTWRYRLGQDAQRFLSGEFPLDEFDADVMLVLEPPNGVEDER